jgi:phage terminase large subunit
LIKEIRSMKIQTTKVYGEIQKAKTEKYEVVSLQGSARASKTYNTVIWLIIFLIQNPGKRLSIVRKTLPAIKGSVFVDFKEVLLKIGAFDKKQLNKTELIYTFSNGSWVEFFSTDDEQKIRGRTRDILFVNEANEVSYLEWTQLQLRTKEFTVIDYNPSFGEDHWINTVNKEKRTYHLKTTYKDNPFLEQRIVDEIESLQHKNKSLWTIYGLGERASIEGLVFEIEIINEIPSEVKWKRGGIDFGYTNDPTSIVEVGMLENILYVDERCYRTQMLARDIIHECRKMEGYKFISESADPRLVQEIYNGGINIHSVEKFKGSIQAGVDKMKEFRICVTKRSTNTIKEFRNYTYQQDKEGKWLNEPIDMYNHSIDSIRYIVLEEIIGRNRKTNMNQIKSAFRV